MNLFFDVVNGAKNLYDSSINNVGKDQKLRTQLFHCTYSDDVKFLIEKSVKQVLHVYPYFDSEILSFTQQGVQKRYIELKGILQIQIRGKICKVDYNMMIPNGFPKKSPYVRIVNRNAQYNVDNYYIDVQSPTDPKSYILNTKLNQIKNWCPSKSIVSVIIQSHDLMKTHFPFTKPKITEHNMYGSGLNKSGFNDNKWGNSPWQNTNIFGVQGNQGQGQGQGQGFNQGFNNQIYSNQGYMGNQGFNQNQGYIPNQGYNSVKQPPIPFNQYQTNISQTIAISQKSIGQQKKILQQIKTQYLKSLDKIQHLQTLKYSLSSQQQYLRKQIYQMSQFLQNNENNSIDNLSQLIQTSDNLSQQILDLITSIKSKQQCVIFLQMKFTQGYITFDQFLKLIKKIQQQKFDQKILVSKCLSSIK